jgi:3-deoxy-D-arabino-heptulosonate 7-phosphate (DAHP) synthase
MQFVSTECKVVVDGGAERGSTYKTQTTAFIFSGAGDEPLSAGLSACAASWTGVPAGTGVLKLEDITIAARGSECEYILVRKRITERFLEKEQSISVYKV